MGQSEIEAWSRIQASNPSLQSPYFRPEFTQAVAAVRNDVFVGIIEGDDEPLGFLPFQRSAFGFGKPVGGPLSDFQGVIAAPGFVWDAEDLIRGCGLRAWDFDHLLAEQEMFAPYRSVTAESPYLDLSDGFERYIQERKEAGSSLITKIRKSERKLARDAGEIRFEMNANHPEVLQQLFDWKSRQYRRTNNIDIFSIPWIVRLIEHLIGASTRDFAGSLMALYANDILIAAQVGMRSRGVLHWWFPAYSHEFASYSPGILLLLKVAEHAASAGIQRIDLGKGDEFYKRRLASGATILAEGTVEVKSLVTSLRRARRKTEDWLRQSPLRSAARVSARWLRKIERRQRFQ
jgi:CelD/BcsL family acetyltransferase involved in cellulose biosynthesis